MNMGSCSEMREVTVVGTAAANTSESEWDNEDEDLLNNPDLLFAECERLPPPDTYRDNEEEFWGRVKLIRELVLDQSIVLDYLSKRDEFKGRPGTARDVLETLIRNVEAESLLNIDKLQMAQAWKATMMSKVFSSSSIDRVQRFKEVLRCFLENYVKIRDFIPKETEENEEQQNVEAEKEMCSYFQLLVTEMKSYLSGLREKTEEETRTG